MTSRIMVLFTILSAMFVVTLCSPISSYAGLIVGLKRMFHTGCVYFVTSNEPANMWRAIQVSKMLNIMTSLVSLEALKNTPECRQNRPLYVMFEDMKTRTFLEQVQVSSFPRWLLLLNGSSSSDFLASVHIPFDCEFLVADLHEDVFTVRVDEVYRVALNWPLNQQYFATWRPGTGLETTALRLYDRRANLQGLVLKASTTSDITVDSNNRSFVGTYYGRIWRILENHLNFTTTMIHPPDNMFGSLLSNGSWSGNIQLLVNKEVDASVDDFHYSSSRIDVIAVLTPVLTSRAVIYMRKQIIEATSRNSFSPFHVRLWLVILGLILLIGLLLTAVRRSIRSDETRGQEVDDITFIDSLFKVFSLFCQQDPSVSSGSTSCRIMLLMAGLTSLVLLAAYSACLTSFTAAQRSQLPFNTIQEFTKDGTYMLGVPFGSVDDYISNKTKDPMLRELLVKCVQPYNKPSGSRPSTVGISYVCKRDKFAWLTAHKFDKKFMSKIGCDIGVLPQSIGTKSLSMATDLGSPYKAVFNHKLRYLRDSGVLSHMMQTEWPVPTFNQDDTVYPKVSVHQVYAIFIILAVGMVTSAIILVLEITPLTADS